MRQLASVPAIAFALVSAFGSPALAQHPVKVTRAGQPVLLRVFFNCTPRGGLPSGAGSASHGTIAVREGRRNYCGNPQQPVTEAIYTPRPGFRGTDEAIFYEATRPRVKIIVQ